MKGIQIPRLHPEIKLQWRVEPDRITQDNILYCEVWRVSPKYLKQLFFFGKYAIEVGQNNEEKYLKLIILGADNCHFYVFTILMCSSSVMTKYIAFNQFLNILSMCFLSLATWVHYWIKTICHSCCKLEEVLHFDLTRLYLLEQKQTNFRKYVTFSINDRSCGPHTRKDIV